MLEHSACDLTMLSVVFGGDLRPVMDIVAKYAVVPDFLKYGEDMTKTLVSPKQITPHQAMWCELRGIHKRLTWCQSDIVKVFAGVD